MLKVDSIANKLQLQLLGYTRDKRWAGIGSEKFSS